MDYFFARQDGRPMLGERNYERVVPTRFASDGDDLFMRSMIQNYAAEAKDDDGVPTAHFWMNKASTKRACAEIIGTHKKLDKDATNAYLDEFFARTWEHFDVNNAGVIEVEKMP